MSPLNPDSSLLVRALTEVVAVGGLPDGCDPTMRQLADAVRGPCPPVEVPRLARVDGHPPAQPNFFSDGSVKLLAAKGCSLGGAGLWIPGVDWQALPSRL
eukprot:12719352-Alexandrium_andersonii.AAC.1